MNLNLSKLVVDIETCAIDGAPDFIEEPSAPSNYKDPQKIADYIRDAKLRAIADCGLEPDLGRICAVGWMMEGRDDDPRVIVCRDEPEERYALGEFWRDVVMDGGAHRRLISFNGLRFDLPYLMRRSLYLNIEAPRLNVDKYRSNHIDLLSVLSYQGAIKMHSLMFYAKRFGLVIPEGASEVDGSMIQGLVNEGAWDAVRAHCDADVRLTYDLAARLRYVDFDEDAGREMADAVGF